MWTTSTSDGAGKVFHAGVVQMPDDVQGLCVVLLFSTGKATVTSHNTTPTTIWAPLAIDRIQPLRL